MPLSPFKAGTDGAFDTPVASAARTATGQSAAFSVYGPVTGMVAAIRVTAATGTTPTLDIDLEDSLDGGTTWHKVKDINTADITTTGTTVARLDLVTTPCTELLRLKWTIGGTSPSFTFSVDTYTIRA